VYFIDGDFGCYLHGRSGPSALSPGRGSGSIIVDDD
jgi:hypothetical protein